MDVKTNKEINEEVFNQVEHLLVDDPWWRTRNNAIAALLKYFSGNGIVALNKESVKKVLNILEEASKKDVHVQVREKAKKAIKLINESQIDPAQAEKAKPQTIKSITQSRFLYRQWNR